MLTPKGPEAVEEVAQSRGGAAGIPEPVPQLPEPGQGVDYDIGERIDWAANTQRFERAGRNDPVYRPLKIFALDPSVSRLDGAVASVRVQYEELEPGPVGSLFEVSNADATGRQWKAAELDDPLVLLKGGYAPSLSEPRFHQQMVYTVAMMTYDTFKVALGRDVAWAFPPKAGEQYTKLALHPHGAEEPNAWYDRDRGEIVFGYFTAKAPTAVAQPNRSYVYTALSHDVIAHEMSHALLDSLRSHFLIPTHKDVLAFHEAFADLVAVFQHFTFGEAVSAAVAKARGKIAGATALVSLAREVGQGLGTDALRTMIDLDEALAKDDGPPRPKLTYETAGGTPHDLGRVLARAVFAAFETLYQRRTRPYVSLATNGSGELPPGDLSSNLKEFLVAEIRRLAGQFLSMCIRAIDYCPPVDVRFGDYLQALITADRDLVPDDDLAYREAIIHAFGAHGIYGEGTLSMTEEALSWGPPTFAIPIQTDLSFGSMRFDGDPAKPVSAAEMRRQAGVLGRLASAPHMAREFGLVSPGSAAFRKGEYSLPKVHSIRSARRVGPDKQVAFDTVAEILQSRAVRDPQGRVFQFWGGSTVIIGPRGDIRLVIRKRVDHDGRLAIQKDFMESPEGAHLWENWNGQVRPARDISRKLCVGGHR
jgi:hypothetical protein